MAQPKADGSIEAASSCATMEGEPPQSTQAAGDCDIGSSSCAAACGATSSGGSVGASGCESRRAAGSSCSTTRGGSAGGSAAGASAAGASATACGREDTCLRCAAAAVPTVPTRRCDVESRWPCEVLDGDAGCLGETGFCFDGEEACCAADGFLFGGDDGDGLVGNAGGCFSGEPVIRFDGDAKCFGADSVGVVVDDAVGRTDRCGDFGTAAGR
mmetsp:Transcript_67533/g.195235  ORF Transcript_67533/g.195235 Transcript_67533/m.195235 type:complete len:214 (+) Transcript_67533:480-1121(+)